MPLPEKPRNALYGKGEFSEDIPYKVISLLKGEVEVKPASNQYADYFFYFLTFCHATLKSKFYTTLITEQLPRRNGKFNEKH